MADPLLFYILGSVALLICISISIIGFIFYRKRNEIMDETDGELEQMTKAKSPSISTPSRQGSLKKQQLPVIKDTQFWVPELYSSIIQPSVQPFRKVSRMQSTLDREIYSRTPDVSYLEAADAEVFDSKASVRLKHSPSLKNSPSVRRRPQQVNRLTSQDYRGMLNFITQYKYDRSLLLITIVKAEALPLRKGELTVDPFVDVQVRPFYRRRMHSEVHQKTQNPIFNQVFEFEVPPYEILKQDICFTILDFSQQLNHDTIGNVIFDMSSLDQDAVRAGKEFSLWKGIDKIKSEDVIHREAILQYPVEMDLDRSSMLLMLTLTYNRVIEKMTVVVNKARNLPLMDKKGKIDHHYVSVALVKKGKSVKKCRTSVVKHDVNPIFNKLFSLEIPGGAVEQFALVIKVRHHMELGRDRTFAVLNIGQSSSGCEGEHWADTISSEEAVTRWHRLVPIELDEEKEKDDWSLS